VRRIFMQILPPVSFHFSSLKTAVPLYENSLSSRRHEVLNGAIT
jgi:hypothetical protein